MRDPNRLDKFYEKALRIHKERFPDMREGQFFCNFFKWIESYKERDPFYLEHEQIMDLLDEYSLWLQG